MKEDVQLICPISYEDKDNIWPSIEKIILDRLPLKDVTWRNPASSSFVSIEKLPLRFLSSSAKLFNETQHPYRRFLAPYVHVYILVAESMDAYKAKKSFVKKWLEPLNNTKLGKHPWIVIYVQQGTATSDAYQKIYAKICNDFYADKIGDRSVMILQTSDGKLQQRIVVPDRIGQQSSNQQAFATLADLLGKLRDGVIVSFITRCALYESDVKRLEIYRGTTQFDFWQLFLVKESFALMYQMLQMPDKSLALYEELEILIVSAPLQSLPVNDWPMVMDPNSTISSAGTTANTHTPSKNRPSVSGASSSKDSSSNASSETIFADSDETSGGGGAQSTGEISTSTPIKTKSTRGGGSENKGDLLSDCYRIGEDVLFYSINQARMSILWNKFSIFQLQHYIFVRQMYFLLVHLRQPIRCAEKSRDYMISCSISIEKNLNLKYGQPIISIESDNNHIKTNDGNNENSRLYELRRMQANTWIVVATLKLIRECRALTQLMVGDVSENIASNSYSLPITSSSVNHNSDSIEDHLAAISSTSTHGNSIVYLSIAELSRSQHGVRYSTHGRKQSVTTSTSTTLESSPANILREALFSPQLEIETALRDSSKILSELLEFALNKLHNISSNFGKKQIEQQAIELSLSVATKFNITDINTTTEEPTNAVLVENSSFVDSSGGSVRRTVTKINNVTQVQKPTIEKTIGYTTPLKGKLSSANEDIVLDLEKELTLLEDPSLEIGNRMDQILVSISSKIRSTSHYWSKLYEVTNLASAGASSSSSIISNDDIVTDTTIDPVSTGSKTKPLKPASLSKSQIQRGHLLELCLFTLGSIVQWHLNLIAGRARFAVTSIIRCADLLMCNDFYELAAKRFEYLLQTGFIAPSSAYLNKSSYRKQHRNDSKSFNLIENSPLQSTASHSTLHGAWLDLWHWTLRKLLYCAHHNHSLEEYRIIAVNILIPSSYNNCVHRLRPRNVLTSLLREVVYLSTSRLERNISTKVSPPYLSILRLPLFNYFDFSIQSITATITATNDNATSEAPSAHVTTTKGYRVVNDELYPSTIIQCMVASNIAYKLNVKVHSKLPDDFIIENLVVVYKLVDPATFSLIKPIASVEFTDSLCICPDEMACKVDSNQIIIKPGEDNMYSLTLRPTVLGEFYIHRFIIATGTLYFEAHLIPTTVNFAQNINNSIPIDSILEDEIDADRSSSVINTEGTKFSALLRYYFQRYLSIQVIPPVNVLKIECFMVPRIYTNTLDDIYLAIEMDSNDEFEKLEISIYDNKYSDEIVVDSTFITEELASPVIRRRKMMNQEMNSDKDDEDIAMANAANALVKLLLQNDTDINIDVDKSDKTVQNSFYLELQDPKDWKTSITNNADNVGFTVQSMNSILFEKISNNKNLFIRIPVKVLQSIETMKDCADGVRYNEVKIIVAIKSTLFREKCSIPIKYSKEIAVLVGPSINFTVDIPIEIQAYPRNILLLQSNLRNISFKPIEVIGYSISFDQQQNMEQSRLENEDYLTTWKVLEGPVDLKLIRSNQYSSEEGDGCNNADDVEEIKKTILLHPGEEYLLGISVEMDRSFSWNQSNIRLECHYKRKSYSHEQASRGIPGLIIDDFCSELWGDYETMKDEIPSAFYKSRTFSVVAASEQDKLFHSPTGKSSPVLKLLPASAAIGVHTDEIMTTQQIESHSFFSVGNVNHANYFSFDYFRLKHHLSIVFPHNYSSSQTQQGVVDVYHNQKLKDLAYTTQTAILGNIFTCQYVLDIRYLNENVQLIGSNQQRCGHCNCDDVNFTMKICETKAWIPVGQSSSHRHLASFNAINNGDDTNSKDSNSNNITYWSKTLEYIFQFQLLPIQLGIHDLPPLQIEYNSAKASSTINPSSKTSFIVYSDISNGMKQVKIVPDAVLVTSSSSKEASHVITTTTDINDDHYRVLRSICTSL